MPSLKETIGCSYQYNILPLDPFDLEHPQDGSLAGKRIDWVPNPAKFILMHEPPARGWGVRRYHWHYAQAHTSVLDTTARGGVALPEDVGNQCEDDIALKDDTAKFLSPVLFVDGHVQSIDFTPQVKANPRRAYEETEGWIWYRPVPPPPPPSAPANP